MTTFESIRTVGAVAAANAPEPFCVDVRPDRERVIVAPHGELDLATIDGLRASVDGLAGAGFEGIVIDLRGLSFMDPTGLCCLVEQCRRRDVTVRLIDGSETVSRLFDLTRLRDRLPFLQSTELRAWG